MNSTGSQLATHPSGRGGLRLREVCTWRGGARAAYSIVHDDVGQPEADGALASGLPELSQRALRAGFACVMGDIEGRGLWPQLAALVGDGHEVLNHSWDHCNLVERPEYALQIDRPHALCLRRLGGHAPSLFAFPYDAFDPAALEYLRAFGYAGARAGERGVNDCEAPSDDFSIRFDTYGPDYSVYESSVLDAHVDAALETGGWALREFHGVQDDSWQSISRRDYATHLDRLVELRRRGELWVDTPGEVRAYRRRRAEAGSCQWVDHELRFSCGDPGAGNDGDLTVEFESDTDVSVRATQAGRALECRLQPTGRWLVDINPFSGPTKFAVHPLGGRAHFHRPHHSSQASPS